MQLYFSKSSSRSFVTPSAEKRPNLFPGYSTMMQFSLYLYIEVAWKLQSLIRLNLGVEPSLKFSKMPFAAYALPSSYFTLSSSVAIEAKTLSSTPSINVLSSSFDPVISLSCIFLSIQQYYSRVSLTYLDIANIWMSSSIYLPSFLNSSMSLLRASSLD